VGIDVILGILASVASLGWSLYAIGKKLYQNYKKLNPEEEKEEEESEDITVKKRKIPDGLKSYKPFLQSKPKITEAAPELSPILTCPIALSAGNFQILQEALQETYPDLNMTRTDTTLILSRQAEPQVRIEQHPEHTRFIALNPSPEATQLTIAAVRKHADITKNLNITIETPEQLTAENWENYPQETLRTLAKQMRELNTAAAAQGLTPKYSPLAQCIIKRMNCELSEEMGISHVR
jgi:hypothetical protein